ncbi:uncharacterized protein LOC131681093 [Topomyia yanbarensis]|uniref:uncharacterized protein LOC131681093 n=1 Tax=Topomyia yanbarensis TaxID=2498891 RepID=UPI00273BFC73|nr:uncharacterized protein LOC131681093 [Topomyia yanbarensis]
MASNENCCAECDRPDWAEDMVQCDECQDWYHFTCAGVSGTVSSRNWSCRICLPISVSSRSSSRRSGRMLLEKQRLEEEQKLRRNRFFQEKELERKMIGMELAAERKRILEEEELEQSFLKEKYEVLERMQEEGTDRRSVISKASSTPTSVEKVSQWMGNDGHKEPSFSTNGANKMAPNPEVSQLNTNNSIYTPPTPIHRSSILTKPIIPVSKPIVQSQVFRGSSTKETSLQRSPQSVRSGSTLSQPPDPFPDSERNHRGANIRKAKPPIHASDPLLPVTPLPLPEAEMQSTVPLLPSLEPQLLAPPLSDSYLIRDIQEPSSMQLASRRVMARDLPEFDGKPEDWPIFISQYNVTTQNCGFSNAENLIRLQRCLKGHARESVRSRLLLPESVPNVIETLRMLYGRPSILIKTLLNRVRQAPIPRLERLETLIEFGMELQGLCDHLTAAGEEAHLNNPSLLQELEDKLPAQLKLQWAMHKRADSNVTLKTFAEYMSLMVSAASQVTTFVKDSNDYREKDRKNKQKEKALVHAHSVDKEIKFPAGKQSNSERGCLSCNQLNHRIKECKQFLDLTVDGRWQRVHQLKLCRTCLNQHGRSRCRLTTKCGIDGCDLKHNRLLHTKCESGTTPTSSAENHSHRERGFKTLFRVVPVTLQGKNGSVNTFAFLDDGSSLTLVEQSIVDQLGESGPSGELFLTWTGDVSRCEVNSQTVSFNISGASTGTTFQIPRARTVSKLKLPVQTLDIKALTQQYPYLKGLPVADYTNASPGILIGLDQLHLSLPLKSREGKLGEPVATKTRLGWCIFGSSNAATSSGLSCHILEATEKDLHEIVKAYFGREDAGAGPIPESVDEIRARKILAESTVRVSGRFETGLIWRYDHFEFPESYHMARRRLECLERRLARDAILRESVSKQIQQYQHKGYAHPALEKELSNADPRKIWYLPLGVVTNPKKPDKIRLIWDAAAKVDGVSLNSALLKGPDLMTPLVGVLFRFRERPIAVSGDICEMFHQIRIRAEDRHSQRFLWRENPNEDPDIYLMDVATFGSTCSPCSAQYVKNRNAEEFASKYPRAVETVIRSHYVDDFLDSFDTIEEAQRIAEEVRMIHKQGGFEIRAWLSNKSEVVRHLGETTITAIKELTMDKDTVPERVLGMRWMTIDDVIGFSTEMRADIAAIIEQGLKPTKRQVLRCVMSLFDPLGLLAAYLVHGKMLIQQIWRSRVDWDDQIDEPAFERWKKWTAFLPLVETIKIPRCYITGVASGFIRSVQLHTFVDASEEACSCVAYFRFTTTDGAVTCAMVMAKTKVAPLKPLSIPRLELQAAVLGARVTKFISDNHSFSIEKRFFWSDSSTVLAWIRSDGRKYRQYVACRIGEILTLTDSNEWYWVPSKLNVADEATKWRNGACLSSDSAWFCGPNFCEESEEKWPDQSRDGLFTTEEELRPCHIHGVPKRVSIIDFNRFSRWSRLLTAVAYVRRYIHNLRAAPECRNLGQLGQEELLVAENTIWQICQEHSFSDEFALLLAGKPTIALPKESRIYKFSPYMDENSVLRQDGRIEAATHVGFDVKYPIILPCEHRVTLLMIDDYHRKYLHANSELVVNEIRQKFKIAKLRTTVKKIVGRCQHCKVYKSLPNIPRMAPLPSARLSAFERPFSYVGVDFFGPILVTVGRSSKKRWVALFTCLTIRAIHLEVAHSLNTESCIMCFRRFVGRRGAPLEVYSDNGTNFHGAEKVLRQQIAVGLADTFTNTNTKWLFNPPSAPHMGGAWERMVRSVKNALKCIDTGKKLSDEGLLTLVSEAESIVNSRPLTYLPLESVEQQALTPNHFLLGSSTGVKQPVANPIDHRAALRGCWNQIRHQSDLFWSRWLKEYLPTICRRTKWFNDTKSIAVGDLVIIADGGKRNSWVRGRVIEIQPGADGRIRRASLQTSAGIMKRPVSKLAILDVDDSCKTAPETQCYGGRNVTTGNSDSTANGSMGDD